MSFDPAVHHRRSIRLKNYDYSKPGYYFVTIVVRDRKCVLGEVRDGEVRLSRVGEMVRDVWQGLSDHFPGMALDEFVVMPNHLHGVVVINPTNDRNVSVGATFMAPHVRCSMRRMGAMNRAPTLGEVVRRFKAVSARAIHRGGFGAFVWQRNYHEHIIRSDLSLTAVRNYILCNPTEWDLDPENPSVKTTIDREARRR